MTIKKLTSIAGIHENTAQSILTVLNNDHPNVAIPYLLSLSDFRRLSYDARCKVIALKIGELIDKYQPLTENKLKKISGLSINNLRRAVADATFLDPKVWQDDIGKVSYLRYGYENYDSASL